MYTNKINIEELRDAVHDLVRSIPIGRATSYGAVARAIGYPKNSRMIGRIMTTCNSSETDIPAHRVVNSQGVLSGRAAFGDASEMQELLEAEGLTIKNNRIMNWKTVFWNPIDEL